MPTRGEHKTVQARILKYAQDIGWNFVSRAEAEKRRGSELRLWRNRSRQEIGRALEARATSASARDACRMSRGRDGRGVK